MLLRLPIAVRGDGAEQWVKPQQNTVKVNRDATLFLEQECYGGAVTPGTVMDVRIASFQLRPCTIYYAHGSYIYIFYMEIVKDMFCS